MRDLDSDCRFDRWEAVDARKVRTAGELLRWFTKGVILGGLIDLFDFD